MIRPRRYVPLILALALLTSGCGGDGGDSDSVVGSATTQEADSSSTLEVGAVPAVNTMVLYVAKDEGFFAEEGVDVNVHLADAGSSIITSTIEGTYDISNASTFPMLLAISQGAPLRAVSGVTPVGPGQGNSGIVVQPGSGIDSYDDLEGKSIATNALSSLTALAVKAAIQDSGGDPDDVTIVPLPFAQATQAVSRGEVDAAVVLEPFATEAVQDGMENIGDPIGEHIPKDSPYGLMFSTHETIASKSEAIEKFNRALAKAEEYVVDHPEDLRAAAVEHLNMSESLVKELPTSRFGPEIPEEPVNELVDLMLEHGYIEEPVDLTSFFPMSDG